MNTPNNTLNQSNHEGTSVEVELVITGEEFDLANITEVLELNPTMQWKKGDAIPNRTIVRNETTWCYGTGSQESFNIEEQTLSFLNTLKNKTEKLRNLKREQRVEYLILYTVRVFNSEMPAISLRLEIIEFACEIDAKIDFDFYFC